MLRIKATDLGSTGSLETSWFQGSSSGKGRRPIMVMEPGIGRGTTRQGAVERDHRRAQQCPLGRLGGSVCMQFDEEPVGPARDLDAGPEPEVHPLDPRRLALLEAAVLDPGD